MSQALIQPPQLPPSTEQQVRSHAATLVELATEHGSGELVFAGPGRSRGHVAANSDPFAPFVFQLAASELLGGEVALFSDEVLHSEHVSPDLLTASPLCAAQTRGQIGTRCVSWMLCSGRSSPGQTRASSVLLT
jgi:hypothetical protein